MPLCQTVCMFIFGHTWLPAGYWSKIMACEESEFICTVESENCMPFAVRVRTFSELGSACKAYALVRLALWL